MHTFHEAMNRSSGDDHDNHIHQRKHYRDKDETDDYASLSWKVGEILMATHEALTMSSGFNEHSFTHVLKPYAYIYIYIYMHVL